MNIAKTKNIFHLKVGILVFLLAILLGGLVLNSVSAAVIPGGIVPCGNGSDPSQRCTLCHLVLGFQSIINWGFNIFIVLALLMLVVAGVFYIVSTGNQGLITTAKGIMLNTLFGFAFVLLAWLMVNYTIYLLGAKVGLKQNPEAKWNEFSCDASRTQMTGGTPTQPTQPAPPARDDDPRENCTGAVPENSEMCPNSTPPKLMPVILVDSCLGPQGIGCEYKCKLGFKREGSGASAKCFKSDKRGEGESCGRAEKGTCMQNAGVYACPSIFYSWSEGASCDSMQLKCCIKVNTNVGTCTGEKTGKAGICYSGMLATTECPNPSEVKDGQKCNGFEGYQGSSEFKCCVPGGLL